MKRRTRLGSNPVKVFGSHVYQPGGTRTKVRLNSFSSVAEARDFAVCAMASIQLCPDLSCYESVCVVRGNGEVVSTYSVFDEPREAPMQPQGVALSEAGAIDHIATMPAPAHVGLSAGFTASESSVDNSEAKNHAQASPSVPDADPWAGVG